MIRPRSARLSKSLADVARRPARTALVVAGVTLGVFSLTAIDVTQDRLAEAFAFSVGDQASQPDLVLDVDRVDASVLDAVRAVPGLRSVGSDTTLLTQWHVERAPGHVGLAVTAYPDPAHVPFGGFELLAGLLPGAGEVVMESGDGVIQPVALGDTVTVDTLEGTVDLRVVGLSRTPGADPATTGVYIGYMSDAALRGLPASTDPLHAPPLAPLRVEHVSVKLEDISTLDETTHAIGDVLQALGISVFGARSPEVQGAQLRQVDGVFMLLRLLTLVAFGLAGILVVNTMRSAVAEETTVIATMKALGGTRATIARGYLVTVAIYSLAGTVVGVILGVIAGTLLATLVAAAIPLALGPLSVDPGVYVAAIAFGIGVPILAAMWPIWDGTRMTVRAAMSGYGIASVGEPGRLVRLGERIGWISQTAWLGLRGTFRRRGRALLTVLMLTVAGTAFFVVQTTSSSVDATVARVWSNIHADVELYASEAYRDAQRQLSGVPGIKRMERVGVAGAQTTWGKVAVWGFEPDTRLYEPRLTSGRWFAPDDTDVVLISDDLATLSGLTVGDRLLLSSLGSGGSTSLGVIGTLDEPVDSLGQSGAVVLPVTDLYRFEGTAADAAPGYVNRILVQATDRTPGAVDALAGRLDAVAADLIRSGTVDRGSGLGPVFLVHEDEEVRHQRNFQILYALLYAVAVVIGAAAVLGLASTLLASVTERQREIGLLRSMGASGRQLATVSWVEGLALGSLAVCAGALLGLPLAWAFVGALSRLVIPIGFSADPRALVMMVIAMLAIVALAGIAPAIRASRARVADLLRHE